MALRHKGWRRLFCLMLFLLLFASLILSPHVGQGEADALLLEGLLQEKGTIWLSRRHLTKEETHTLYSTLLATHPSLFFVSPYYAIAETPFGGVAYLRPTYRYVGEARNEAQEDYESRLSPLLSPAREMGGQREQLTYLHDYLTTYFAYDTRYEVFDPYGLLTQGVGVCQAFSLLFFDLCQRLHIPCEIVISPSMRHQWNRVCLDGVWLAVDLVWDLAEGGDQHFLIPEDVLLSLRTAKDPAWQYASYFYYG